MSGDVITVLAVALGAAVGAPARYVTDRAIQTRHRSPLPLGTLAVNVGASFILGLVTGGLGSQTTVALVGTGFCGALSTYSTYSFETLRLVETDRWRVATAYVVLSIGAGLGAASLGVWLTA